MECDVGEGFNTYISPARKHTCTLVHEDTHTHTHTQMKSEALCATVSTLRNSSDNQNSLTVSRFSLVFPPLVFHLFVLSY